VGLFIECVYLASALSVLVVALLYRGHPFRRLPSASVFVAFVVGILASVPVVLFGDLFRFSELSIGFRAVVAAPLLEETVKLGLFVLTVGRLRFPNVVEPADFAVLFGILGVGFGIYEDLWYIFGAVAPLDSFGTLARFHEVLRTILTARAFPGHVLFGAIGGFLVGAGRFSPSRWRWGGGLVAALGLTVLLHAGFNAVALTAEGPGLLAYVAGLLGLFLVLRRRFADASPFRALQEVVEGRRSAWPYPHPPEDYLFAEGFAWPGHPRGGWLEIYPVALSLGILFPIFLVGVYFLQRGILAIA
jgi:hypothetical protein